VENLYARELLEAGFASFACDINCHDTGIREGVAHRGMSTLIAPRSFAKGLSS
jgi:hypothetical protein